LLVDQGEAGEFLDGQLKPNWLEPACAAPGHPLTARRQQGYDYGHYFIANFMGDHLEHHARALR
jgi:S-formylglutathione hydrolase